MTIPLSSARSALLDETADVSLEVFRQARLRQEDVDAHFERALLNRSRTVTGQEDDLDAPRARVALEMVSGADPGHARHRQVHHDDIRLEVDRQRDAEHGILRHQSLVAELAEVHCIHVSRVGVVVDDEHAAHTMRAWFRGMETATWDRG